MTLKPRPGSYATALAIARRAAEIREAEAHVAAIQEAAAASAATQATTVAAESEPTTDSQSVASSSPVAVPARPVATVGASLDALVVATYARRNAEADAARQRQYRGGKR